MEFRTDGHPSGRFISTKDLRILFIKTAGLLVTRQGPLSAYYAWQLDQGGLLVNPNFLHFKMMEATAISGSLNYGDFLVSLSVS